MTPSTPNLLPAGAMRPLGRPAVVVIAVLSVAVIVSLWRLGAEPYGAQGIAAGIERVDSAACARLGFGDDGERRASCMAELAAVRREHEQLLLAYGWY